jgi:hypothetical protein
MLIKRNSQGVAEMVLEKESLLTFKRVKEI